MATKEQYLVDEQGKRARVSEALPLVAGHLAEQRALPVHHLVVDRGADGALGEGPPQLGRV